MNGSMSHLAAVRLVAGRELSERLRSRATRFISVLMPLLVVLLIAIPALVHLPSQPTRIALAGPAAQSLRGELRAAAGAAKMLVTVQDRTPGQAMADLKAGRVDAVLAAGGGQAVVTVRGSVGYFSTQTLPPAVQSLLQATLDAAHRQAVLLAAGVSPATLRAAFQPVPLAVRTLKPLPTDQTARDVAGLAAAMLLYMTILLYGQSLVASVAQEKTSRMAEVLLGAVRSVDLLTGKVVGMGIFAFGQMAITVAAGLVANAVFHSAVIPGTIWVLLPMVLFWFVLGYTLYSFGFAVAGALVGRQEDVQYVVTPFNIPLVLGFLLTYLELADPTNVWVRVISFLPPMAPVLMPARMAVSAVAPWEMPLAAILTLLAIYGEVRIAGRVCAPALVAGGGRLSWRTALSLRRG